MTFDQIVGNPPFSDIREDADATNTNSLVLYDKFIDVSCRVARNVVMIVPAGWTAKSRAVRHMQELGLKKVLFKPHSVFPTVYVRSGITAVYFGKNYTGPVAVTTSLGQSYTWDNSVDLADRDPAVNCFLSRLREHKSMAGVVLKGDDSVLPPRMRGSMAKLFANYGAEYAIDPDPTRPNHVLAWVNGNKGVKRVFTSRPPGKYHDRYKVVGAVIAGLRTLGTIVTESPGVTVSGTAWQIPCASAAQARLLRDYLDSDLVKFIISHTKFNDILATNNNCWRHIPQPPIDKWVQEGVTDISGAVEAWLELTPQEIALIDAQKA